MTQELYEKISNGSTDFSDEEAELAICYCLKDYRTADSNYTAALVNATGGDWSGMIRNMLCALRDKIDGMENEAFHAGIERDLLD